MFFPPLLQFSLKPTWHYEGFVEYVGEGNGKETPDIVLSFAERSNYVELIKTSDFP